MMAKTKVTDEIRRGALCELARRSLFEYCKLTTPRFYRDDRAYQRAMCRDIQDFLQSDDDVLVLNAPPRHGKSLTARKAACWIYGHDLNAKIMTGSYNERLSTKFSRGVRNEIAQPRSSENLFVFSDVFPGVGIEDGNAAANEWQLAGAEDTSYVATSPGGTATGFGAKYIIVDDIIKNAKEAYNERVLEDDWEWFTDTLLSRLEEGGKLVIIMTRWCTGDVAGRAMRELPEQGWKLRTSIYTAVQPDGTMLCPEILSAESYEKKKTAMSAAIAEANYNQAPIDLENRLYKDMKTYTRIPEDTSGRALVEQVRNYTDTADTGEDYLCSVTYAVYNHCAYVLDVYYTQDSMERTEPELARRLQVYNVGQTDIESNNGGRGFARNVERETRSLGNYKTRVNWFHQTDNKLARIRSNAFGVTERVFFPADWETRWPGFYLSVVGYQATGENAHDDAADALTGIVETLDNAPKLTTYRGVKA